MSGVSQDTATAATTDSFLTALTFNAIVFGAELAAFSLLRPYFPAIYEPRTYVPPKKSRIATLVNGPRVSQFLMWPLSVYRSDYRAIKAANGLDAYFFVRFLRTMVEAFLPIWIISWIVLLPVTSVHESVQGKVRLDKYTFGNVQPDQSSRYAAHIICIWFFTFWIFYLIRREMSHFIIERQLYLMDPARGGSVQANTLLVTGIPAKYLNPTTLRNVFDRLPGGVRGIWINRDLKSLPDTYDDQVNACGKLESGETKLLSLKTKRAAEEKKTGKAEEKPLVRPTHKLGFLGLFGQKVDTIDWAREEIARTKKILEEGREEVSKWAGEEGDDGASVPEQTQNVEERERDSKEQDAKGQYVVDEDVYEEQEGPSTSQDSHGNHIMRRVGDIKGSLSAMGAAGKALIPNKPKPGEKEVYTPLSSAFILFHQQISAHLASQALVHHEPYRMTGRYIEVSPKDVIWGNLGLNPYEMKLRLAISYAATAGLIILWAFPVAFIGAVSNISTLCTKYHWLAWICTLPSIVVGIIQGILPPVLLAVLMMLLPIVLRRLAQFEGIPKRTGCELSLMNRFFIFQVIHSFLIVTLASGIIASLDGLLSNPTSIPSLLATNLPKASTFFLTYIILQGLSGAAGGFLQIVPLIIYYVKLYILGSTPRSVWGIRYGKSTMAWGTAWPGITLLVVISLGYSIIAPIINGLACFTFAAMYLLYKYLFLWAYDFTDTADTGGLFFPRAIQHVFVGMYVQQVCLAALFFLATDANGKHHAIPEGALTVVLIVFTVAYHLIINNSYDPLIHALPLSLADKMHQAEVIEAIPEREEDVEMRITDTEKERKTSMDSRAPINGSNAGRELSEEDEYGFAHPSVSRPQRTIWIPRDEAGEYEAEIKGCEEAGIDISSRGATMDGKGKVDVSGAPPDVRGWWDAEE